MTSWTSVGKIKTTNRETYLSVGPVKGILMIITAKRLVALAVIAVLGSAGFAFANANYVNSSGVGRWSGPLPINHTTNAGPSVVANSTGSKGTGGDSTATCTTNDNSASPCETGSNGTP